MRIRLAEKLLAKIMGWSPDEISRERPLIQALANFKYDQYHQFNPGMRYIESLMRWLEQFEFSERNTAYEFVKNKLIFISNDQISQLVSIAFTEKINPFIIERTAEQVGLSKYCVNKIIQREEYKLNLRQSLFIGLSDGSRIDQFRRSSLINNEQVSPTYNISLEKAQEMIKDLGSDNKFNSIFLIDDFTASGKSFFRPEENKGKIYKFLSLLFPETVQIAEDSKEVKEKEQGSLELLINKDNFDFHILFYIATSEALVAIDNDIKEWKTTHVKQFKHTIQAIQILNESIKSGVIADTEFVALSEKYFDDKVINDHYRKGKHDSPYLGFNECALPLVIHHNTPNNSLPILWYTDDNEKKGLFPRITRHKE